MRKCAMNNPQDKLYRHINWDLIVRIAVNGEITQIVKEPPKSETLWWSAVRVAWFDMIHDRRRLTDEEWDYFKELKDA